MTIAFDATLGGSSANSYIPVATADDLMPLLVVSTRLSVWTNLQLADKQVYLMRSVKMIEAYVEWEGRKYDPYQPIGWPRDWVYGPDNDVYVLPHDKVPMQVQEAQALMALNLAEGFSQDDASQPPIDSLKISSLQIKFNDSLSARSSSLLPMEVIEKLRGFGTYLGASGQGRAVSLDRS
jgi:hypothetical protein